MLCRVVVNYPIKNFGLTYIIPEGMSLQVGDIVDIPLGNRKELGCVFEIDVTECEYMFEYIGKEFGYKQWNKLFKKIVAI
jgi:primosomal protein N'